MQHFRAACILATLVLASLILVPVAQAECDDCTYDWGLGWHCDQFTKVMTNCVSVPAGCRDNDDEECMEKYGPGSGNIQPEQKSRLLFDPATDNWLLASHGSDGQIPPGSPRSNSGCAPVEPFVVY